MKKILFLCVANSARSQMAEGLARQILGRKYDIHSAGSQPAFVHPLATQALNEVGIDSSQHKSKSVHNLKCETFDLIITLCADEVCPNVSSQTQRMHWPLEDPANTKNEADQSAKFRQVREQIKGRLEILKVVLENNILFNPEEFHLSIRTKNLPLSVAFYTSLLGAAPKEWTHRYAIFYRPELQVNFVILVDDGLTLHHDTLYHLGVGFKSKDEIIAAEKAAHKKKWPIHKPARTTWRGTPLHELWLKDPDQNLVELYARLSPEELASMPDNKEPLFIGETYE